MAFEFDKMPGFRLTICLLLVAGAVLPGTTFLLGVRPDFFRSLDFLKLLLASAAIAAPPLVINAAGLIPYMTVAHRVEKGKDEEAVALLLALATMFTILTVDLPALFRVITGWGDVRGCVAVSVVLQIVACFVQHKMKVDTLKKLAAAVPPSGDASASPGSPPPSARTPPASTAAGASNGASRPS